VSRKVCMRFFFAGICRWFLERGGCKATLQVGRTGRTGKRLSRSASSRLILTSTCSLYPPDFPVYSAPLSSVLFHTNSIRILNAALCQEQTRYLCRQDRGCSFPMAMVRASASSSIPCMFIYAVARDIRPTHPLRVR